MQASGEAVVVGDDRILRQPLERQGPAVQQFVAGRDDHAVCPAVAGQGDQRLVLRQRLGGDADVGFAGKQHAGDLIGRALVQVEGDLRIALAEVLDHRRQGIARLRMGGGNGQPSRRLLGKLLTRAPEVVGIVEHALHDRDDRRADFGQRGQALAGAHEDLDAELVLELADLPADARLRGMQGPRDLGQVESLPDCFSNRAQLLEVHVPCRSGGPAWKPDPYQHCGRPPNAIKRTSGDLLMTALVAVYGGSEDTSVLAWMCSRATC